MSNTRRGASDRSWQWNTRTGHPNSQQLAGKFGGEPYLPLRDGNATFLAQKMDQEWELRSEQKNTLCLISPGSVTIDLYSLAVALCPFSCLENFLVSLQTCIPTCAWNKGVPRISCHFGEGDSQILKQPQQMCSGSRYTLWDSTPTKSTWAPFELGFCRREKLSLNTNSEFHNS